MSTGTDPTVRRAPWPVLVAAALAGAEGVVFVGYFALELLNLSSDRLVMGLTTSVFFAVYGAALLVCAAGLVRGLSWSRSPVVVAQLIQLPIAWSFRGDDTTALAVTLAVVALLVLGCLFLPGSSRYLDPRG